MINIDIIVPCYNEEEVLHIFYKEVGKICSQIEGYKFNYLFVDDGSVDNTLKILKEFSRVNSRVKYISFSRNFGKESAMYAGLKLSSGDMVLIMDSDMQNPPGLIPKMIEGIKEGYNCSAGFRQSRKGDGIIRNFLTNKFYKITDVISDVDMPNGAGDFRLMTRKMVNAVLSLSEVERFSKGIFSFVGFKTKWIGFENVQRAGGTSKWSFVKLFSYAMDGITAFSTFPLKIVSFLGFIISSISFVYLVYIILETLISGIDVPGYASLITVILFIGGIIILSCGVLGEYISKIYLEVKNRPVYVLSETNIDEDTVEK